MALRTSLGAWFTSTSILAAEVAFAAHPLQTEDTATQGEAKVEIENGFARNRAAEASLATYQLQISYGLTTELDLIVQPGWVALSSAATGTERGLGTTNLDAKWRFFGEAPLSLALRAGAALATGRSDLGLPSKTASPHATLVATFDAAPISVHGNLGYTHVPGATGLRRNLGHVSTALMWAPNDKLTLIGEVAADSNPDPDRSRWPVSALVGAIWTIRPGLDADAGYQTTAHALQTNRAWLLGLTWRFAP